MMLVAACGGQAITGTFTLTDNDVAYSPSSCSGTGGYSDIRAGVDVVVRDGDGAIVGTGRLVYDPAGSSASRCHYTFEVPVTSAAFYELEVGRRGGLAYSRDDLASRGWTVAATLGE